VIFFRVRINLRVLAVIELSEEEAGAWLSKINEEIKG